MLLVLGRAEAVRAGWMSEAVAVMLREPLPGLDQVNLGTVVAAWPKRLRSSSA